MDGEHAVGATGPEFGRNPRARGPVDASLEEAFSLTERHYTALVEHSSDVISVVGAGGEWLESSAAGTRLLGYPRGFDPDGGIFSLVHPDDVPIALGALAEVVNGTRAPTEPIEFRVRAANGEWRVFETLGENRLADEAVGGIVITSRDITERRRAEELLRESEERFRILAETASEAIAIGLDGRVLSTNASFLAMYGYEANEVIGMEAEAFLAPESQAGVRENIEARRNVHAEFVAVRKDGSRFPVSVTGRSAMLQGRPVRVTAITDLTHYKRHAAFEERRRLARDLHDGLAHELAFIASSTRTLLRRSPDSAIVEQLASAAERAIDEARRAISLLSAGEAEPPLSSIAQTAEDLTLRHGMALSLDLDPGVEVTTEVLEALLRILREAITNAGRHANATSISVRLWRDTSVHLEISDNGSGFEPSIVGRGFGLVSMKERAEAIGGGFAVHSSAGEGTRIEVVLP